MYSARSIEIASLAILTILSNKLKNSGFEVGFSMSRVKDMVKTIAWKNYFIGLIISENKIETRLYCKKFFTPVKTGGHVLEEDIT